MEPLEQPVDDVPDPEGGRMESVLEATRRFDVLLAAATERVVALHREVATASPVPEVTPAQVRSGLESAFGGFRRSLPGEEAVAVVDGMLRRWSLHLTHPRYFGLFNPNVTAPSVAGDLLAAGYNPQLAAWSHAPFANEAERYVLDVLGRRLGLRPGFGAHFTSGGAEANHTALLTALVDRVPGFAEDGLVGAARAPVIYASAESHHSLAKIARACGMGRRGLRTVAVDDGLALRVDALEAAVAADRERGLLPVAVVATAGTTGAGVIDPLDRIAELCRQRGLWLHVDAAWGGAACLSPRLAPLLSGIEAADSVTWDAHKWLSVPMGAGMFFCAHPGAVVDAFGIETPYMPAPTADSADPYASSLQWSRRTIGLKVLLSLATLGVEGHGLLVERQTAMGDLLRRALAGRGWQIVNRTRLPLVCFTAPAIERGRVGAAALAERLHRDGFWISSIRLDGGEPVLRACVTNHLTGPDDVEALAETVTLRLREAG